MTARKAASSEVTSGKVTAARKVTPGGRTVAARAAATTARLYQVRCTPDDGGWLAEVIDDATGEPTPGLHTGGRTLRQVGARIEEAIRLWYQLDDDPVAVVINVAGLEDVAALRRQAAEAQERAATATLVAVRRLSEQGVSTRDVADVLGMSHQRVHQLLNG